MKRRKKTDVEQHGSDSLMVFLVVVGLGYLSLFIYSYFTS